MIDLALSREKIKIKNKFLAKVFGLMSLALLISGTFAYATSHNAYLQQIIFANPFTFFALIILQLSIVYMVSNVLNSISSNTATLLFLAYSALNGMILSYIFVIYTNESIVSTFIITSVTFLSMAFYGYTTSTDLREMGTYFRMGIWGIIVATLVNMFLRNTGLEYIISIAGVIIFTGLTAWDVQMLQRYERDSEDQSGELKNRMAITFALKLYLDFINLFIYLLRLLGRERN